MNRRPPKSTLFPYPPPFRSQHGGLQMNGDATVFRATGNGRDDGIPGPPLLALRRRARPQAIYGAGLWVFIGVATTDRKSTRLNSSHTVISYRVFCLQ